MCKRHALDEAAPNPSSIVASVGTNFKEFAARCGTGRAAREILRERDYHTFEIAKKGTTEKRVIEAPNRLLKELQREVLALLETLDPGQAAHGFTTGKSNKTAADHIARRLGIARATAIGTDLRKAFPTVTRQRIKQLLRDNFPALSKWQLHVVTRLCCRAGVLATGSPCSPIILNLCAKAIDDEMLRWTGKHGGTFIRYADDCVLIINSQRADRIAAARKHMRRVIRKHGFTPHPDKHYTTRIGTDADHAEVVGLRVAANEVKTFKKFRRRIRAMLYQLVQKRRTRPEDDRSITTLKLRLGGMLHYNAYSSRPPTASAITHAPACY